MINHFRPSSPEIHRRLSLAACAATLTLLGACATVATTTSEAPRPLDKAAEAHRDAPEFTPEAMIRVANSLRDSGDHLSALRLYQQVEERAPDNLDARLGQGEMLLELGAVSEAERHFRLVIQTEQGSNGRAEAGLARALVRQGRAEEALLYFETAAAKATPGAAFFNHYGVTLDLLGRHEDAQIQYGRGLDQKPKDAAMTNNLALSFALSENYATAVRLLSELVTASPDASAAKHNLALVYGLSGDMSAAEQLTAIGQPEEAAKSEAAYIAQLAKLPVTLRPRAIILGLDAVVPPKAPTARTLTPEETLTPEALTPDVPTREIERGANAPSPQAKTPTTPEPLPVTTAKAETKAAAAPTGRASPTATLSRVAVQLGAYPNEEMAARGWAKLQERAPDLLASHAPVYWTMPTVTRLLIATPDGWGAAQTLCATLGARDIECLPRRLDQNR